MTDSKDIFLSYKKEDRDRVRLLVEALELQGWTIWWDPDIRAGEQWSPAIESAITGARCIVVAWSELSVQSPWVHKEARQGEMREILMPVMLDKVAPPFEFEHLQGANLVGWTGSPRDKHFLGMVQQIESLLGKEAEGRKESAGRQARRVIRYRAHIVASIAAFLSLGGAGAYLATTVPEARDVQLLDVTADEARFTLAPPSLNQSTGAASDFVIATTRVGLTEVTVEGSAGGSMYIPSATGSDGGPTVAAEYPAEILRIGPPDEDGSLDLAPLELPIGSRLAVRRPPGSLGYRVTLDSVPEGVSPEAIRFRARGRVSLIVPGGVEGILDFGTPGKELVFRPGPGAVGMEIVPFLDAGTLLLENLSVSQLELSRVDEVVELGASRATRVSTVASGTMRAAGIETPLGPAATVRFASFEGVIGRLEAGDGAVHFNASGRSVTGMESGSDNVYASIMSSRWRALNDGWRVLMLVGAVLWLAALLLLVPRFWRAPR